MIKRFQFVQNNQEVPTYPSQQIAQQKVEPQYPTPQDTPATFNFQENSFSAIMNQAKQRSLLSRVDSFNIRKQSLVTASQDQPGKQQLPTYEWSDTLMTQDQYNKDSCSQYSQMINNTDKDTQATSRADYSQMESRQSMYQPGEQSMSDPYDQLVSQVNGARKPINKEAFTMIRVIGTGQYGKVLLVRKRDNGQLYAMKVLKKDYIVKKNQVRNTWTERRVLERYQHPFIVKMSYAFQTERKLFLVLDYCPGGELFFYTSKIGQMNEKSAKFYAACLLLALEYLHENGVIYRDLKPENVLIDKEGYAQLTDFGLSKDNLAGNKMTYSFCGTYEYIAPEIVNKQGYTKVSDWWSFGCVLYEMLTSSPPFYSKKQEESYHKIRTQDPTFYNFHSRDAQDLLSRLLCKDASQRLGVNGAGEIKKHMFFADVDWELIYQRRVNTPYTPRLKMDDDVTHFDKQILDMKVESPLQEERMLGGRNRALIHFNKDDFQGFSYNCDELQQHDDDDNVSMFSME